MIESVLFKGVQLLKGQDIVTGDVWIEAGKIKAVQPQLSASAEQVIHEPNLLLMPGVIDAHVHFRDPGHAHKETLYSGSRAAASGGVTTFFDMPNTNPATTTLAAMAQKKQVAAETSLVNYNFFIGATPHNLDDLCQVENVAGIKIYVGSSTGDLLVDGHEALSQIFASANKLIAVHSEDEATIRANQQQYQGSENVSDHNRVRSPEAAILCTQRLCELALAHQQRLHICHLTTQEEAEYLTQNWAQFQSVISTEVTPQHLHFVAPDLYEKWGTFGQINPPIRDQRHQDALWQALLSGVIGMIATDHAPHQVSEKALPYGQAPSGMPGVEWVLPVMLEYMNQGRMSLAQVSHWLSAGPAQTFGILNKGHIKPGYDADLVLVDLSANREVTREQCVSKCGWSPYEGLRLRGWPVATMVNGQVVYREGDFFEDIKGKEVQLSPQQMRNQVHSN
ncbi:MAG: dihydroorotase [Actinobacteria bacterium]|nr:dihydroorotase [Actinomycetota bacterium]